MRVGSMPTLAIFMSLSNLICPNLKCMQSNSAESFSFFFSNDLVEIAGRFGFGLLPLSMSVLPLLECFTEVHFAS